MHTSCATSLRVDHVLPYIYDPGCEEIDQWMKSRIINLLYKKYVSVRDNAYVLVSFWCKIMHPSLYIKFAFVGGGRYKIHLILGLATKLNCIIHFVTNAC